MAEFKIIFDIIWPFVGMFITAWIGWYFKTKKTNKEEALEDIDINKEKADSDSIRIKNIGDMLLIQKNEYDNILKLKDSKMDDLILLTEKLELKVESMERKIDELVVIVNKQAADILEKDSKIKVQAGIIKKALECRNRPKGAVCPVIELSEFSK